MMKNKMERERGQAGKRPLQIQPRLTGNVYLLTNIFIKDTIRFKLIDKKMEKKVLYLVIVLLAVYVVFIKVNYSSKVNIINQNLKKNSMIYSNLAELEKCLEIEEKIRGSELSDATIIDSKNQKNTLYDVLSKDSRSYHLILLTSFESCSTCRDQTIKNWNRMFEENSDLAIIILFSENKDLNNTDLRKTKAYLKGMDIKIPFFINVDSSLLSQFGLLPEETPLSLIIDRDKKVISVNRSSELTIKRALRFSHFFKSLNYRGTDE